MTVKFLHISDTHLGFRQYGSDKRAEDMARSLAKALQHGLDEGVDFAIIPGDFYETQDTKAEYFIHAMQALQAFRDAGKEVYMIAGNHDKKEHGDKKNWLDALNKTGHCVLLSHSSKDGKVTFNEWDSDKRRGGMVTIGDVRILGVPYLGAKTSAYIPLIAEAIPQDDKFNVLMMHCGITGQIPNTHDALDPGDFKPLRPVVDYLATGHYHKRYNVADDEGKDWIFNPGGTENRSSYEVGIEHGYYIVEVDPATKSIAIDFHEGWRRPFHIVDVEVAPNENKESLHAKCQSAIAALDLSGNPVVYLQPKGVVREHYAQLQITAIREELLEEFGDQVTVLRVSPKLDKEEAVVTATQRSELDLVALEKEVLVQLVDGLYPGLDEGHQKMVAQHIVDFKKVSLEEDDAEAFVDDFQAWKQANFEGNLDQYRDHNAVESTDEPIEEALDGGEEE